MKTNKLFLAILTIVMAFSACDVLEEPYIEGATRILSFRIEDPETNGVINESTKKITLTFPEGTDVTNLTTNIVVTDYATVQPASGVPQDFTNPVEYVVTSMNGEMVMYTVEAVFGESDQPQGKTVLLKDFTGVRCVNCPAAAELAHAMQSLYGENLIVMSVHAGFLAMPMGGFPDFRTDEGDDWYNNNNSNPLGAIDRVKLISGYTLQDSQWEAAVAEAFEQEQSIEIRIKNTYDEASRQLTTTINAESLTEVTGDLYLTVCLVEDNIIGMQTVQGGVDSEYVHRHVFRGTLNGGNGEAVSFGDDGKLRKTFTYSVSEGYNASNCSIVAYIYDNDQDMLILQTAEKHF